VTEWTNVAVCKTVAKMATQVRILSRAHMDKDKNKEMKTNISGDVERNKAASRLCKQLFPQWCKPPTQGELQKLIIKSWSINPENDEAILHAGNWWLWARELFIENTITKKEKEIIMDIAARSSLGHCPVHFVASRSPELLHAQVKSSGDPTLPRSKTSILKLSELAKKSNEFLPTKVTIIFADLAIDNLTEISQVCDVETTIQNNIARLEEICNKADLANFTLIRMSQLVGPQGKLSDLVSLGGKPKATFKLDARAITFIDIATKESFDSHQRMFGWTHEQSQEHNTNLGISCQGNATTGYNNSQ
jgi:hypothetical protein